MKTPITTIRAAAGLVGLFALVAMPASADFVINDDLIVDGSACVGFDCVNGEVFGFDTLKLKEHNLRIKFDDTSVASGFPTRTWQILVNDSSSGGLDRFSVEDIDAGRIPFTIEGNADAHSLYVDTNKRIGIGTNTPVLNLHVKSGNTPALRLEQDGTSGFTPQTWDVAGNETNFFVRDATFGSRLPFRIQPNSPTNSIFIEAATGEVGMGTNAPDGQLHIVKAAAGPADMIEITNNGNSTIRVADSAVGDTWAMVFSQTAGAAGGRITMNENAVDVAVELTLEANGNLTVRGNLFSAACVSPTPCGPDYVFEPDYPLMPLDELDAFITANKHLPNVPSAEEMSAGPINVNTFQMRLLEKIEELTLYAIEQRKTINAQQSALDALAARLATLEPVD